MLLNKQWFVKWVIALALLVAMPSWAEEPEQKDPQQWTKEEVETFKKDPRWQRLLTQRMQLRFRFGNTDADAKKAKREHGDVIIALREAVNAAQMDDMYFKLEHPTVEVKMVADAGGGSVSRQYRVDTRGKIRSAVTEESTAMVAKMIRLGVEISNLPSSILRDVDVQAALAEKAWKETGEMPSL